MTPTRYQVAVETRRFNERVLRASYQTFEPHPLLPLSAPILVRAPVRLATKVLASATSNAPLMLRGASTVDTRTTVVSFFSALVSFPWKTPPILLPDIHCHFPSQPLFSVRLCSPQFILSHNEKLGSFRYRRCCLIIITIFSHEIRIRHRH